MSYRISQARGWIIAAAASLRHSQSQCQIQAMSVTCMAAHSNAGSLTHWARPGTEPESSWTLVGFATTEPQQELPTPHLRFFFLNFYLFYFWPCPQHTSVPKPGIKPAAQQPPEPLQWQCQVLINPWSHRGSPMTDFNNCSPKSSGLSESVFRVLLTCDWH